MDAFLSQIRAFLIEPNTFASLVLPISKMGSDTSDKKTKTLKDYVDVFLDLAKVAGDSLLSTISRMPDATSLITCARDDDILDVVHAKYQSGTSRFFTLKRSDAGDYLRVEVVSYKDIITGACKFSESRWCVELFEEILQKYIRALGSVLKVPTYYYQQYIAKHSLRKFAEKYLPEMTVMEEMTCMGWCLALRRGDGVIYVLSDDPTRNSLVICVCGPNSDTTHLILDDAQREYRNAVHNLRNATSKQTIPFSIHRLPSIKRMHCDVPSGELATLMIIDVDPQAVRFTTKYYQDKDKIAFVREGTSMIVFRRDKITVHPISKKIQIEKIAQLFEKLVTLPDEESRSCMQSLYPRFVDRAEIRGYTNTIRRFSMFLNEPARTIIKADLGYLLNDKYLFTPTAVTLVTTNTREEKYKHLLRLASTLGNGSSRMDVDVDDLLPLAKEEESFVDRARIIAKDLGDEYIVAFTLYDTLYVYHTTSDRLIAIRRKEVYLVSPLTGGCTDLWCLLRMMYGKNDKDAMKDLMKRRASDPGFEEDLKLRYECLRDVKMSFPNIPKSKVRAYVGEWCIFSDGSCSTKKERLERLISSINAERCYVGVTTYRESISELMDIPFEEITPRLLELLGKGYEVPTLSRKNMIILDYATGAVVFQPHKITSGSFNGGLLKKFAPIAVFDALYRNTPLPENVKYSDFSQKVQDKGIERVFDKYASEELKAKNMEMTEIVQSLGKLVAIVPQKSPVPESSSAPQITYRSFLESILRGINATEDEYEQYLVVSKIFIEHTLNNTPSTTPEMIKLSKFVKEVASHVKNAECSGFAVEYVKWEVIERLNDV